MYKLPQLPQDQFAAFVCALFEQLLDDDFTLNEENENLIESASGRVTILAVPLSIEQHKKDALEVLKEKVNHLLLSTNKKYEYLIIATNYVLNINAQSYLDDLRLNTKCLYLDWQSISILSDNRLSGLNFSRFYPSLNFQDLPYNFKSTDEEITYYQKSISIKREILGDISKYVVISRYLLAEFYEGQHKYLESLELHKMNALVFDQDNTNLNESSVSVYIGTYINIGSIYYLLGDYNQGINWFKDIYSFAKLNKKVTSDDFFDVVIGLINGYNSVGDYESALKTFVNAEIVFMNESTSDKFIALSYLGMIIYDKKNNEEKAFFYFNTLIKLQEDKARGSGKYEIDEAMLKRDFSKYYEKLKKQKHLINTTLSPDLPIDNTQLPFALKQVHIKGFQSIKDLKIDAIPVDAQWIFITGKNGSGKSSLLKAITAGIVGDVIQEHIRPSTEKGCIISVELLQDNTNQIQTLKSEDRRWQLYKDKELDVRNIPLLAYGVSRLNIQTEGSEDRRYKDDHVFSLFKSDEGNLSNIEEWLKDEMLKILKGNGNKDQYEMVKKVLSKLMPSVSKVAYNDNEAHIEYTENGEVVKMERLASGNKSILAMVGDILIRLLRFYPNAEKTTDFKGIIIIDELDLHLHPSWQRELPWLLSKLFPKIQFICSTHSIIPFMGAPKNSVFFTVDRTEEEGTTIQQLKDIDVSNLSANILLSSPLFEVSLLSKVAEAEGKSQEYRTESDYKEYDENVKSSAAFKRMQEKYGDVLGDKLFKK